MHVPTEALTSARAFGGQATVRALLPAHIAARAGTEPASHVADTHPLAVHIPLWSAHVDRLVGATAELRRAFPEIWGDAHCTTASVLASDAVAMLLEHVQQLDSSASLRASLRVSRDGTTRAVVAPLPAVPAAPPIVRIDTQPTLLYADVVPLKTDARDAYDEARARVGATLGAPGSHACFDVLMWRVADGARVLTESSIANVVVECADGSLLTPAFAHLLPGVLLRELVRQGLVRPATLRLDEVCAMVKDIHAPARLYLCNAVRGLFPVRLG